MGTANRTNPSGLADLVPATTIVQSTFDFAIREINALEQRIVTAEDDADGMLWDQAQQVVTQLDAGRSQRQLAKQWINARTGKPYSDVHVHYVAQVLSKLSTVVPRPRFRDAYNEIANAPPKSKLAVHHSSDTPEHYTPPEIIEAVVACLGTIDLDPCSNPGAPNVPATRHFTIDDDGLEQTWAGVVYMNPPYGRDVGQWVEKLCTEHEKGDVQEAIALLPARVDTQWFARLRDYPVCFVTGRLTFVGNEDPAPFPSVLFYLGEDLGKFYQHFIDVGDIWRRMERGVDFGE
jgi:DNA N-6-adenine-methyltransferase (Dam)